MAPTQALGEPSSLQECTDKCWLDVYPLTLSPQVSLASLHISLGDMYWAEKGGGNPCVHRKLVRGWLFQYNTDHSRPLEDD